MPLPIETSQDASMPERSRRRRRILPILLILIGLGAASGIGWTLATNTITLNSGSSLELGQGAQTTTACDAAVSVAVTSAWDDTAGGFAASQVVVSNYDFASACAAKTLTFVLADASNNQLTDGTGSLKVSAAGVTSSLTGNVASAVASSGTVTITLTTKVLSSSIAKIAVQTA